MIRTTIVGYYPKVSDFGTDHLPGVIDRWQRQMVSDQVLEEEIAKVIRRVIQEQEEAGLDLVTDGQIRWEDLAHGMVRSVEGIKRGSLRRFFDNNVYYRRLEIDGEACWQKSAVAEEFHFTRSVSKKPVKCVLPGPLTLVVSTEAKPNQTPEKLLSLYRDLLRKEIEALEKAGAKEIQLDEPAFQAEEPLLEEAVAAINFIFDGIKARRWVACYFNDVSSILPTLAKLQVEVFSLDLVSGPGVLERLKEGIWKKEVALGLIDARNTKLESAETLKYQVAGLTQAIPLDRLWLSSNCGLEFLPHASALKKLKLLKEVASSL